MGNTSFCFDTESVAKPSLINVRFSSGLGIEKHSKKVKQMSNWTEKMMLRRGLFYNFFKEIKYENILEIWN